MAPLRQGWIDLGETGGQAAASMRKVFERAGFQTLEVSGRTVVLPDVSEAEPFELRATWLKSRPPDLAGLDRLAEIDFKSHYAASEPTYVLEDFDGLVQGLNFRQRRWWLSAYMAGCATIMSPDRAFTDTLPPLAEAFLRDFPTGSVEYYRFEPHSVTRAFLTQKLAASSIRLGHLPESQEDWRAVPLGSLQEIGTSHLIPRTLLSIGVAITAPLLTGFVCQYHSGLVVFKFGRTKSIRTTRRDSAEHWWREDFWDEGRDHDWMRNAINDANRRKLTPKGTFRFTPMQERAFWLWYVSKANRLYASIINPRYFTKNGRYDAFRHFQTYKTMLRIADMVHAISSGLPAHVRRTLLFDVVDQFAALRAPNEAAQADEFKTLFSSGFGKNLVKTLASTPFGKDNAAAVGRIGRDVLGSLELGFLWGPARSETECLDALRDLRNTRHGYFPRSNRAQELMVSHTGNLPDQIDRWAVALWLWLLCDPLVALGLSSP